mmetsp:Transcript_10571/g.39370  ORF Transcript_10571/g.39370 Transcript_10571/m.39370 type:complete len:363 (-) Transcript_10571:308-1396(-)
MGSFASTRKKKGELPPRIIEVTSPSSDSDEDNHVTVRQQGGSPNGDTRKQSRSFSKNGSSKRAKRQMPMDSPRMDADYRQHLNTSNRTPKAGGSVVGPSFITQTQSFGTASSHGTSHSAAAPVRVNHSTTISVASTNADDSARDCTVLFEWSFTKAKEVSIAGTFSDWESIEMHWNHEEAVFQICLNIFAGCHMFRYIVDGEVRIDPRIDFSDYDDGHPANIVTFQADNSSQSQISGDDASRRSSAIRISSFTSQETSSTMIGMMDDPEEETYGQEERAFSHDRKNPPLLPPHISYTPLNYPTLRSTRKAMENMEDAIEMPMHVTLQHMYMNSQYPDLYQIGMSARYQKKWISVEFFSPKVK